MKLKRFLLILIALLPGCLHVGPDFRTPGKNYQESWTENSNLFHLEECPCLEGWWENYHDEVLNELVIEALDQNYTVEAAAYRIIAARANLGIAIGEYFPQTQQLEGSLLRTHISANAPNTLTADRDFLDGILGLRVAWELDFWGRFYRGVQAAYGEYVAAQEDYKDVQRILISDIVLTYVLQNTIIQRKKSLDHNIALQYRSVEIAKVRWEEGYESELDYEQAVALWQDTVGRRAALETELKRTMTSLAILLGETPADFSCRFTARQDPLSVPDYAAIAYPATVICRRPDLQRALALLYAQNAEVGLAVAELYPKISFTGFLGLECASDTHSTANLGHKHFFSRNSLSFVYGPAFSWPILNYGRLINRVRQQYAFLQTGVALYRQEVLAVYKEVDDAMTFFASSLEEASALEASYKAAKRSVAISTLQYQEGLADYSRVLNSLQLQVEAEDKLAQARGNIGIAYATIYRALGGY